MTAEQEQQQQKRREHSQDDQSMNQEEQHHDHPDAPGLFERLSGGTRNFCTKTIDATILNSHPCGAPIDGLPQLDGAVAKDMVDATILNKHPCGAPIDGRCKVYT